MSARDGGVAPTKAQLIPNVAGKHQNLAGIWKWAEVIVVGVEGRNDEEIRLTVAEI